MGSFSRRKEQSDEHNAPPSPLFAQVKHGLCVQIIIQSPPSTVRLMVLGHLLGLIESRNLECVRGVIAQIPAYTAIVKAHIQEHLCSESG